MNPYEPIFLGPSSTFEQRHDFLKGFLNMLKNISFPFPFTSSGGTIG